MPAEITATGARIGPVSPYSKFDLSRTWVLFVVLSLLWQASVSVANEQPSSAGLKGELQALLAAPHLERSDTKQSDVLRSFYQQRDNAPAWVDAKRLMEIGQLEKLAELHGLVPADYLLPELKARAAKLLTGIPAGQNRDEDLAAFELLATQSIVGMASHLRYAKVDLGNRIPARRAATNEWQHRELELLSAAADSESLFSYLNGLAPDTVLYRAMQASLAEHRRLVADSVEWTLLPTGSTLEPGVTDPRVALLRQRLGLAQTDMSEAENHFYDANLALAVADFQARHMLDSDGLVGKSTVQALNISIRERVDQLLVNLEWRRWAAMPEHQEYLVVNVAQFAIHLVDDDERIWTTRTQVGRYKRQTPTFKSALTSVVANPSWTVPPTIFREDVLPELQADRGYLRRKNMRVIDAAGRTVDSQSIDWEQTTARDFPYRLRAKPSKGNALGRMKFQMPNPYLIYLHDTPSRRLFENDIRTFSSGCIRLEQPEQLAQLLVERQSKVSPERLNSALAGKRTRHIELDAPMPIVVMYGTVDMDDTGRLVFARDVYRRDKRVLAAMNPAKPDERDTILLAALGR